MECRILAPLLLGLVLLSESVPAQTPNFSNTRRVHAYASLGFDIGEAGFVQSTAPGLNEIFFSSFYYDGIWHAYRFDSESGSYIQTYLSETGSSHGEIRGLAVADFHSAQGDEIAVATYDGLVRFYGQVHKNLLYTIDTGVSSLKAFAYFDFDQDGYEDFAVLGYDGLEVFSSTGAILGVYPDFDGKDLVIGQMDQDAGIEIATSFGKVLDFDTGLMQCQFATTYNIDSLALSDFDQDGMEELLYGNGWDATYAVDIDTCQVKWSIPSNDIGDIIIGDTDMDGSDEIIIGEDQWGSVIAYDLVTQIKTLEITNPNNGVTSLVLGDFDLDGELEIMWAGKSSGGDHEILVGDIATEAIEWQHIDLIGPFFGPLLGDVDGDGIDEVISASHESNYWGYIGGLLVFEQDSLAPDIFIEAQGLGKFESLALADINNDQVPEILVGGHSAIKAYNFQNGVFTQAWDFSIPLSNVVFTAMDAFDVDGDGDLEVVAGSYYGSSVYVVDVATQTELWHSLQMGTWADRVSALAHGDFDGDGEMEIAGMVEGGPVYLFAADSTLEAVIHGEFYSMKAHPKEPNPILVLGNSSGALQAYGWNGASFQVRSQLELLQSPLIGFTPMAGGRVIMAHDDRVSLFQSRTGGLLWQSEIYEPGFGKKFIRLLSGEMVTAGRDGIYSFGIR